jgi:hypothetical protein
MEEMRLFTARAYLEIELLEIFLDRLVTEASAVFRVQCFEDLISD